MINISQKDTSLDWSYDGHMQQYLLWLLSNSSFEERLRMSIERNIKDIEAMDKEKYEQILFNLFSNQLDRVTHGYSYNMGDIKRHLKKLK